MGLPDPDRPQRPAVLTESLTSPRGKRQFRRAMLDTADGSVTSYGPPASHHLRWLASANGLLDIPEDVVEAGRGHQLHGLGPQLTHLLRKMTAWHDAPAPATAQHMLALVRSTVPPVHPAGRAVHRRRARPGGLGRNHRWLRRAGLLAAGACAAFFRHPPRVPPTRPGVVVAPADGVICVIDSAAPPAELGMGDAPLPRVSIFLSLLDAHVQRAPVSGEVIAVQHRPGRFGSADLPAASTENERTSVRIRTQTAPRWSPCRSRGCWHAASSATPTPGTSCRSVTPTA